MTNPHSHAAARRTPAARTGDEFDAGAEPSAAFLALGVPRAIAIRLAQAGLHTPYPIQTAALPDAFAGRDVAAQSPTGSGKTLAFAIPLVARLSAPARPRRPRALVLAPTRELAAQIAEATRPLAAASGRTVALAYGGTGYGPQITALRKGADVLVGCPGRVIDLQERGELDLSDVEIAVLDEADRMADMGFLPAVRRLLDTTPVGRQTMLFSATLGGDVERLVRDYQRNPVRHVLATPGDDIGSRRHEFWRSERELRGDVTASLVSAHGSSIVFCRTKHGADRLARQLSRAGVSAVAIHGDRSQAQRERALAQFRSGEAQVLVGTDVASRGLHVDGVDCVIHFDPPADDDTYVHRSGRTGRAGASGLVVSLLTADQEREAMKLAKRVGVAASIGEPRLQAPAPGARAGAATRDGSPPARAAATFSPPTAERPQPGSRPRSGRRAGGTAGRRGGGVSTSAFGAPRHAGGRGEASSYGQTGGQRVGAADRSRSAGSSQIGDRRRTEGRQQAGPRTAEATGNRRDAPSGAPDRRPAGPSDGPRRRPGGPRFRSGPGANAPVRALGRHPDRAQGVGLDTVARRPWA